MRAPNLQTLQLHNTFFKLAEVLAIPRSFWQFLLKEDSVLLSFASAAASSIDFIRIIFTMTTSLGPLWLFMAVLVITSSSSSFFFLLLFQILFVLHQFFRRQLHRYAGASTNTSLGEMLNDNCLKLWNCPLTRFGLSPQHLHPSKSWIMPFCLLSWEPRWKLTL